jgi:isopentenyl-diphosphate delta-isomerase
VFNTEDKLLLQQRSHKKVTWPLYWSNTCCSHPSTDDSLDSFKQGIIDRVKFELGFNLTKLVSPGDLKLVGKVLYKAKYDEYWGEYELDYVFFVKQNHIQSEAQIAANGDEVNSVKWVAQQELLKALETTHLEFTPWFRKMVKHTDFMQKWSSLDCLEEILDPAIQELPSD